jgi:substrate import-associated zinc metallohydrolase lipoprotein
MKMKIKINSFILLTFITVVGLMSSCRKDELDESIFDTSSPTRTTFDNWLLDNYTDEYNIEFLYKFSDNESDRNYNLIPAELGKSKVLAQIVKHVWLEAYDEVAGIDFTRKYVPKMIHLIGSGAYSGDGTVVLGTAEGGLKVTLYSVNDLKLDISYLNEYYFHVMHHEFAHILHQTKSYDQDFKKITESSYVGNDWYQYSDSQAQMRGFITAYSQYEPNEDFVETYSMYVTHDQAWWNKAIANAGTTSAALLTKKLETVRIYFQTKWNINIDTIRTVILRRGAEVPTMTYLNF